MEFSSKAKGIIAITSVVVVSTATVAIIKSGKSEEVDILLSSANNIAYRFEFVKDQEVVEKEWSCAISADKSNSEITTPELDREVLKASFEKYLETSEETWLTIKKEYRSGFIKSCEISKNDDGFDNYEIVLELEKNKDGKWSYKREDLEKIFEGKY